MLLRQLIKSDPILNRACHIKVSRDSNLPGGCKIRFADRKRGSRLAYAHWTALAVIPIVVAIVIFRLAKIGQNIFIAPANTSHLSPFIVVERIPPRIYLRIDTRSTTDNLGLRVPNLHILHMPLRHCFPAPGANSLGHF